MKAIEAGIKNWARELGFELAGIAAASPADGFDRLREWLARDFAGQMTYMHRHAEARRHPASILPAVRSVVMVAMSYAPDRPEPALPAGAGRVARYARGPDYHIVLKSRLKQLHARIQAEVGPCRGRAVVDTAPLLERDCARRAGLGWFGKNTMLLNRTLGSYFLLGGLLLDLALAADPPFTASHCGSCTACLDACPTAALVEPGWLDSRRCISYLTIELRGPVPETLRHGLGDWLFGCDICQEVCPWNRKAPPGRFPVRQDWAALDLVEILSLAEEDFERRFGPTPLGRPGWSGLRRNAALILGNRGDPAALPGLQQAASDPDPGVAEAARWAIRRIHGGLDASPGSLPTSGRPEAGGY